MSNDLENSNLKSNEKSSLEEFNVKEKANVKQKGYFCHICNIKCCGNKNFTAHLNGRKHCNQLKVNEKPATKQKNKHKIIENSKQVKKDDSEQNLNSDSLNSSNAIAVETMDSHRNDNKYKSKALLQNRKYPINKNLAQPSKNFNYYHRNQYPFSHHYFARHNYNYYKNQRYSYHAPYNNYSASKYSSNIGDEYHSTIYPNADLFNKVPNFAYNSGYSFQPDYVADDLAQQNNPAIYPFPPSNENYIYENEPNQSEFIQEHSLPNNIVNSNSQPFAKENQNTEFQNYHIDLSLNTDDKSPETLEKDVPFSAFSSKKQIQSKRSRSLGSVDSSDNNEKRKDEGQNLSEDINGVEKHQKIKDWTNNLLETNHGRISRLIHPSNYKDKAAVNQLITNLSKSKRKENLSRLKFRSDSGCSAGSNDDDDEKDILEEDNVQCTQLLEVNIDDSPDKAQSIELSTENVICNKTPENANSECTSEINTVQSNKKKSKSAERNKKTASRQKKESSSCSSNKKSCKKGEKGFSEKPKSHGQNFLLDPSNSKNKSGKKKVKSSVAKFVDKMVKRKSLDMGDKSNKKRCFDTNTEIFSDSYAKKNLISDLPSAKVSTNTADITKHLDTNVSFDVPDLKEEVSDTVGENPSVFASGTFPVPDTFQNPDPKSEFSVETLINLFATGNVKVKNEFSDPAIDVIKSVDPNILLNACSANISVANENGTSVPQPSNSSIEGELTIPESCLTHEIANENRNGISSGILSSTVIGDNLPHRCERNKAKFSTSDIPAVKTEVSDSNSFNQISSNSSLFYAEEINFLTKNKPKYTPELKNLIEELRKISLQEEQMKQNLLEAKYKIREYQKLLEEWKNKEEKLQRNEENLRKKRNEIIELMQNVVRSTSKTSTETENEVISSLSSKEHLPLESVEELENSNFTKVKSPHDSSKEPSHKKNSEEKREENAHSSESDEISIISVEVKSVPPEIIVLDDDNSQTKCCTESSGEIITNTTSNVPTIFDVKNLTAHSTIINCLLIFEDFLYTSSNDFTAKRFNIKNPTDVVTYLHVSKNVTEIVVEKVQNENLVFTCSNRIISLFIASDGTKIKTFFHLCPVTSICKGWGKFYCGISDGTIFIYNWKYEEKEIIKTDNAASRIATAHQGRLHVLIILSSNGNISIRDAETGLLIRCIRGFIKLPSYLSVNNDLAYLSSSDKSLTILDILTGRTEKKIYLSSQAVGLAVYNNYIFTISYNGLVNCFNKDKLDNKMMYYGAGKNCLTCLGVYEDWIFTGNRKGEISVIPFEPSSNVNCQFGQCCAVFGLKEDLAFHVEKEHLMKRKSISKCNWGKCNFPFPPYLDIEAKMQHMNKHIF